MTRTKKQLENILLVRTAERFRKTKIEKIEIKKVSQNYRELEEYTIELAGFKFRLYFSKDLIKNQEEGHLWILNHQGYVFESFDLSNEYCKPVIIGIYEDIQKRILGCQEKQRKKEEREFNKNLKRLDRIL